MALASVKLEMTGTGGGRYCTRAEAKDGARKRRRRLDRKLAETAFILRRAGL